MEEYTMVIIGRLRIVMLSVVADLTCRFSSIPNKMSAQLFMEIDKAIQNLYRNAKDQE